MNILVFGDLLARFVMQRSLFASLLVVILIIMNLLKFCDQ